MRLATRLPMIFIGVVVVLLIPAPFTSGSAALNDLYENYIGALIIAAGLGSILIAGVMGAVIMMGWRAGFIGVIFTASIVSASVGALTDDTLWTNLGMAGFALSCVGYYLIGELSGFLPIPTAASFGSIAIIPAGIIMAVVGVVSDNRSLVLLGLGSAGAAVGVTLARLYRRRKAGMSVDEAAVRASAQE